MAEDLGLITPAVTALRDQFQLPIGDAGLRTAGFVIAAAIDRYVYITLHQTFVQELILKYSKMERV